MNSFPSHLCGHGGERGRKLGGEAATVGCERSAFEGLSLKGSEEKARTEKGQQEGANSQQLELARFIPPLRALSALNLGTTATTNRRGQRRSPDLQGCPRELPVRHSLERCLPLLTLRVFLRTARPALAGGPQEHT